MTIDPREIIRMLHESGVLYENNLLYFHAQKAVKTGNFSSLKIFLQKNPWIMKVARERLEFKKQFPFELPSQEDFPGEIPVGIINQHKDKFCLSPTDLTRHLLIMGLIGAGKSNLMTVITLSTLLKSTSTKCLIFEPKREYRSLTGFHEDFIVMTPRSPGTLGRTSLNRRQKK